MNRLLIIIIFFFIAVYARAQEQKLSFHFSGILFKDLADTIERKSQFKIYYTKEWIDSLYLDINSDNDSVEEMLNKALRKVGLSFVVKDNYKIILTKGYNIKTNFKEQFETYHNNQIYIRDTSDYVRPNLIESGTSVNDEYKVFTIGKLSGNPNTDKAILSGSVRNSQTGDPVAGAVIFIDRLNTGTMTNKAGFYSISLPKGNYKLESRMIGMKSVTRNLIIHSDGMLNILMADQTNQLNEVSVSANKESLVKSTKIGINKINISMLKRAPTGMGEADVIKSTLLLPGVQTVGEAANGYNVRGGGADQNLVLLNDAPILNSAHFFGFFSAFNSDMITDMTLYKSIIPAKYGGRLSSVMEITAKEGNNEKVKISGGISPVTCRLLVDGPIKKDKSTFIIGARTTYSDWILDLLADKKLNNSKAGFVDIQALYNTRINEKNSLSFSGYISKDKFDYYRENTYKYGNLASTLKWKHSFGTKLSAQFSAILSNYNYYTELNSDSSLYSSVEYRLNQNIFRTDFLYFPSNRHHIEFGFNAIHYSTFPGVRQPIGDLSVVAKKSIEREQAIEPSLYISDEFEITPDFSITGGLRGTWFSTYGPATELIYNVNDPLSTTSIIDTVYYDKGKFIKNYPRLEFRISSRLILSSGTSLKIGVQRLYQYLHMISNTTSISPTDVWKLSDSYIEPERGDQFSIGLYNNFENSGIETSIETYYKKLSNILDYKGGAELLMNDHLETDIIKGNGKAYGIELMAKKEKGIMTGWVSYTYSRIFMKVDGKFQIEKINGGNYFPANYDKPHDFKIIVNTRLSRRFNISGIYIYNTGRPITLPVAFYNYFNTSRMYYSNRNEYRIPDYMRLDLSATLNGNLKSRKLNHSSFTFTVYNLFGRRNPYSVFFKNEDGIIKGYQMSIFGRPLVMVTYNFKILGNASDDY